MCIKNFLKKIFPLPAKKQRQEFESLKKRITTLSVEEARLSDEIRNLEGKIWDLHNEQLKWYQDLTRQIDDQIFREENWLGTTKHKRDPQIIVSMTTYPARIHFVRTAIKSIMNQSVKADRIILWLAKQDFPNGTADLPASLLELTEKGLEICWCDTDYRSYKKLLPAFENFPNDLIITADDDLIYPNTMIEQLYHSWEIHPACISTLRVHLMKFNKDYSLAPYREWGYQDSNHIGEPRFDLFATTGAGTLFPPHILPKEAQDWNAIEELCPYADDIWIKMMSLINDVQIILTSRQNHLVYIEGSQEGSALWKINSRLAENNEQIKKVIEAYPVLKEKMIKCARDKYRGPLLPDQYFFTDCLNLNYQGMNKVKEFVVKGNFSGARKAFAEHIRENLNPEKYFQIPFKNPSDACKLPGETDAEACRRIQRHEMVAMGIPCDFGKDGTVNWEASPMDNDGLEWTLQLNRHDELKLLAKEYRATGEEWLAETAAELFTSWVRQAMCPGDCPGTETECWRTLECGIRMSINWPYALFSFYKSKFFTDDLLVDWYKSVWEHGNRLSKNYTSGDWLIAEMNGLGQIGTLYPQFIKSEEWLEQVHNSCGQENMEAGSK